MGPSSTVEVGPGVVIASQGAFRLCFVIGAVAALAGAGVALAIRATSPTGRLAETPVQEPATSHV